jgi:hypothetical protein
MALNEHLFDTVSLERMAEAEAAVRGVLDDQSESLRRRLAEGEAVPADERDRILAAARKALADLSVESPGPTEVERG